MTTEAWSTSTIAAPVAATVARSSAVRAPSTLVGARGLGRRRGGEGEHQRNGQHGVHRTTSHHVSSPQSGGKPRPRGGRCQPSGSRLAAEAGTDRYRRGMTPAAWTAVGVPIDSVGRAGGTELAPAALRSLGLLERLGAGDRGDLDVRIRDDARDAATGVVGIAEVLAVTEAVRGAVRELVAAGRAPARARRLLLARARRAGGAARRRRRRSAWRTSTATSTSTTGTARPPARPPTCRWAWPSGSRPSRGWTPRAAPAPLPPTWSCWARATPRRRRTSPGCWRAGCPRSTCSARRSCARRGSPRPASAAAAGGAAASGCTSTSTCSTSARCPPPTT